MRRPATLVSAVFSAALLGAAAVGPACADEPRRSERYEDSDGDHGGGDQERAREALMRGEVLPLDAVLRRAGELFDGRMIEAELEREDGRWVYELTLLGRGGRVVEAVFDAATAELLELEGEALEEVLRRAGE